ncbi:MAG: hypothetical protein WCL50_18695 [Spirochaetota bacterium]
MSTVDRKLADEIVKGEGYYKDDPQVKRIVEYDNAWGGVSYGLEYAPSLGRYVATEYVRNPRVYWSAK